MNSTVTPACGQDVPATYRAAVKRLQRTVIGKHLQLEKQPAVQQGMIDVFPIAWAIGAVGDGAADRARPTIVVVRDNDTEMESPHWFALVPLLLGASKDSAVTTVLGSNLLAALPAPAPLRRMRAPTYGAYPVHVYARTCPPPSTVVFTDIEARGSAALVDLMRAHVGDWLAAGTEVILLADTAPGLALFVEAIDKLGGLTDEWTTRYHPSYGIDGITPLNCQSVACRLLLAPTDAAGFPAVVKQLDPHFDIISDTLMDCSTGGVNAGAANIGYLSRKSEGDIFTLPFRAACIKVDAFGTSWMAMGMPTTLGVGVRGPQRLAPPYAPSQAILDLEGRQGTLARYHSAIAIYAHYYGPELATTYGDYVLNEAGDLEPVGELAERDTFDLEPEWPHVAESEPPQPEEPTPVVETQAPPPPPPMEAAPALVEVIADHGYIDGGAAVVVELDDAAGLRSIIDTLMRRLALAEGERDAALRRLALERHERASIAVASSPAAVTPPVPATPLTDALPQTWDDFFVWAHKNFEHAICFTSRARRAARKSVFRDIPQVASAIEILSTVYRDVRLNGSDELRKALEHRCKLLGFSIGPVGEAPTNHRTEDIYTATWQGQRYALDSHLCGSSSRDQTRGLRIYFSWLPDTQQLLCGHLPNHLPNSRT